MNVPEKIYLFESRSSDNLSAKWLPDRLEDADIEYTRTDVFIKKAVSFLNSKLYDWVKVEHFGTTTYPDTMVKQDFIKDFKEFMKEE